MKAIIHIGTEKTGTTSIQEFLYKNRTSLNENGFHFIQSPGKKNNRKIPAYCIDIEKEDEYFQLQGIKSKKQRLAFNEAFLNDFKLEMNSLPSSVHTVIFSSEHFHSRVTSVNEIKVLRNLLKCYFESFEIVCYVRHQSLVCESLYSTAIKFGHPYSFPEFLSLCEVNNIYYNYCEMLLNWRQIFNEDITVRPFNKVELLNNNLLDDFTSFLSKELIGKLNTNLNLKNESLNNTGLSLGLSLNKYLPTFSAKGDVYFVRYQIRKVMMFMIKIIFKGKSRLMSENQKSKIHAAFKKCNKELQQNFNMKNELE